MTRDDNPFTMLNRDATGSEPSVLPEAVPCMWSTNDMLELVMIDVMIQLVTTAMVDKEIIDVMVRIVMSVMMVEEQELRHHVVDLHMEEVKNQDVLNGGIMGKSTDGGLSGGHLPRRDFFVYRLMKDSGEESLRNFMMSKNIELHNIVAENVPDARFNSFKVSVSLDDAEKMWDVGVCVKRWVKFEH